ncbi:2-hydroxyacid dehydrogenase [Streptomyces sp. NPDC051018]|uniref:2-hydroxyacid dehydrogenase n=1 Tax=Streptomyces sp. NPDC051018 TaxID=3365639 RepID=UPI0037BD2B82
MRILAAGDHFVRPELLRAALDRELAHTGRESPDFAELTLPWPHEPFGPVAGVREASGTEDQLIDALSGASVCVTQMAPFTERVFASSPELRMVAVSRGGPVNVDLDAATRHGVAVSFAPGRNAPAAAEFAVGLMLAAMRRINSSDADLKRGVWRGDLYAYEEGGIELSGATVGLIGYGAIGRIVARVLLAFGAEVLVADPYTDPAAAVADGVRPVGVDDLLRRSSVVSLHARLTPETRHLLDARRLALLPHGAVLVNSARGGLLDHAPLPELLRSGRLGALALDVYDVEPIPDDWALRDVPNVITTPHLAGATRETAHRAASITAAEVGRFVRGEALAHPANPDVLLAGRP